MSRHELTSTVGNNLITDRHGNRGWTDASSTEFAGRQRRMAGVKARAVRVAGGLLARAEASRWTLWLAVFVPLTLLYLLTTRTNPMDMSADPAAVTPSAWQLAHFGTPRLPSSVEPFGYHNDWL